MAKAFLMRTDKDAVFQQVRLELREPGFSKDLEKFYIGGLVENIHIPNESYVQNMIDTTLSTYGPTKGDTATLADKQQDGTFGFNTETNRLSLKVGSGSLLFPTVSELGAKEQIAVVVSDDNIDSSDGHVLLSSFTRPVKMIFVDGILCIKGGSADKRYEYDPDTKDMKVFGCVDGSTISYF